MPWGWISSYFVKTDRTICFQHRECNFAQARDAMLPHRLMQLIQADVLPGHAGGDDLAILNQQTRLSLNQFSEARTDVSGPVIAFCTALLNRRRRLRSKGVICPTSRYR